jgi:hypothetical protein
MIFESPMIQDLNRDPASFRQPHLTSPIWAEYFQLSASPKGRRVITASRHHDKLPTSALSCQRKGNHKPERSNTPNSIPSLLVPHRDRRLKCRCLVGW